MNRNSNSRKKSDSRGKSCGDELKDGARKLVEGFDKSMQGTSAPVAVFPSVPKHGPQYSTPEYEKFTEGVRRFGEGVVDSMHGESKADVFPFVPKHPPQYSTPGHDKFTEGVRRFGEGVVDSMHGESKANAFPFVPKHPPQYGPEKVAMRAAYSDSTSDISGVTYSESSTSDDYRRSPSRRDSLPHRPRDLSTVQEEEQQRYSPQRGPQSPVSSSGTGTIHGDSHQGHRPSSLREEGNRDIVSSPPPRSRVPTEKSSTSSHHESRRSAKEERPNPQTRPEVPEGKPTNTSPPHESRRRAKEERRRPQTHSEVPEDKSIKTSSQRESRRESKEGKRKNTTSSAHSRSAQAAESERRISNTPSGKARRPPSTTSSYAPSVATSELIQNNPPPDKTKRPPSVTSSYAPSVATSELPHNKDSSDAATIRAGKSSGTRSDKNAEARNRVNEDKGAGGRPPAGGPAAAVGSGMTSKSKDNIEKWLTSAGESAPSTRTPPSSQASVSSNVSRLSS